MRRMNVEVSYESVITHELDLPEEFEGKEIYLIQGKWDEFRIDFTDGTYYDFISHSDPEADVKYPATISAYDEDYEELLGEW